ncbi:hypothetical protein [Aureivirga sp. CE67]|uniref:hypothetical protein n=1 Tax=Aureivirga sp. CE67 TaxID=1788983 RepID=UPI0018CB8B45|nr:hypothetical protein [Aureivirga sp. CE67]
MKVDLQNLEIFKMKYFYLIVFLFLNIFYCRSQKGKSFKQTVHNINTKVIKLNQINKVIEETYIKDHLIKSKFLGSITNELGNVFSVVNTIHIIINKNKLRTHINFVMIYSDSEFKGYYYLSYTDQLPNRIEKSKLIFSNACEGDTIELNFNSGIPSILNLKCNSKSDIYEFIRKDDS